MSQIVSTVAVNTAALNAIEDRLLVAGRMIEMAQRAIDRIPFPNDDRTLAATLLNSAEDEIAKAIEQAGNLDLLASQPASVAQPTIEEIALCIMDKFEARLGEQIAQCIPLDRLAACLNAKAIAAEIALPDIANSLEIDLSDLAEHLDISASDIAEELSIDAEDIASHLDISDVAGYIDCEDVAQHVDPREVAKYIKTEIDASDIDLSDLASEIDYDSLADQCAEKLSVSADDVVRKMLQDGIRGEIIADVSGDEHFQRDVSAKVAATMAKIDGGEIARQVLLHGSEAIAQSMLADKESAGRLGDAVTTAMARRMIG
jgi:predicted ArsR family transcriptional regulator